MMTEIRTLVCSIFDTSIWIKLIKENAPYNEWEACGVVPFLPLEVLLELVDVDESNRLKRLTYLSQLPQIATLPLHSKPKLGGVPYLISLEYLHKVSDSKGSLSDFLKEKIRIEAGAVLFGDATDIANNLNAFDSYLEKFKRTNAVLANPMLFDPRLRKMKISDFPIEKVFAKSQIEKIGKLFESRLYKKSFENDPSYGKELITDKAKNMVNQGRFDHIKDLQSKLPQDMPVLDFLRLVEIRNLLKDISENLNIPLNVLETIDFRDITILNILDAYKEEYCKELWRDKQRKIESSSYVDGQLVAFSYFMPVMVDVRTALFVERMNERGFQLNCFQASNVDEFLKQIYYFSKSSRKETDNEKRP